MSTKMKYRTFIFLCKLFVFVSIILVHLDTYIVWMLVCNLVVTDWTNGLFTVRGVCDFPYPSNILRSVPKTIPRSDLTPASLCTHFAAIRPTVGACSSVVGLSTMLEAGRSRFRFLIRLLDFIDWSIPSSRIMALGSTQSVRGVSISSIAGE
jgi:hypothetical protein